MNNIYDETEITFIRALQLIFLGAFIPMVTSAMVMDIFVSMFSFMVIIFPVGFWYTAFLSIVFVTIMILILYYGIHKVYDYLHITGKARRIADISYILMTIASLTIFTFPQP